LELFEDFLKYYDAFLSSKKLSTSVTPQLLSRMQALLPDERRMWVVEGRLWRERLGGLLIACYGDTCLALAGSSPNPKGRSVHSGNLVWWQTIVKMKELGYRWLDVGGTHPEGTPQGILHFKAGLGGVPYRLVGELENSRGGLFNHAIQWSIQRTRRPAHQ